MHYFLAIIEIDLSAIERDQSDLTEAMASTSSQQAPSCGEIK
jgi:hypothetical protein